MRVLLNNNVAALTATQLDRTSQLYRLVAGISDGLGSENTDFGQVLLVANLTFSQARGAMFPKGFLWKPLSETQFRAAFSAVPGVAALLSFSAPYKPAFGLYGAKDEFHPNESDRGTFWVCAFLSSRRGLGGNALIRFQRVET